MASPSSQRGGAGHGLVRPSFGLSLPQFATPCPPHQAFGLTLSPHWPLEFSRWDFCSKSLSGCAHPKRLVLGARGLPASPLERPVRWGWGRPWPPADPCSPLRRPHRLQTHSRFIFAVYCARARPPSQLGAGRASRGGPRRPTGQAQSSPPPTVPLAALCSSLAGCRLWSPRAPAPCHLPMCAAEFELVGGFVL